MNQTASNLNAETQLSRSKLPTNRSNNEQNNTIQLRDFYESDYERTRISVARAILERHFLTNLSIPRGAFPSSVGNKTESSFVISSEIRSVRILDTIVCSESLVWLFSPAWDAVKLTLPRWPLTLPI